MGLEACGRAVRYEIFTQEAEVCGGKIATAHTRSDSVETVLLHLIREEQVDIYGECPQFDYPCKLLSTEREVFTEGMEMHHCIYTNYWHQIKEHKYLAFSFEAAERFTLGLKLTNNGWEFDQAYCKYDKQVNEGSKVLIEQFLADPVVKNKLMGLADKGQVPHEETASVNPTDGDDEWLRTALGAA